MTDPFAPALLARAAAAPEAAAALAAVLGLVLVALGPLPHAARAALRLALPPATGARLRRLTGAVACGLRLGIAGGIAAGWAAGGGPGAVLAAAAAAAGLLALCDLRWRWLPLDWTLALALAGLALAAAAGDGARALAEGLGAAAALGAVRAAHRLVRGVEGLGLGDLALAGAMGACLGLPAAALAVAAAAGAALLWEAARRCIRATEEPERTIPLGAWLSISLAFAPFFYINT